MKLSEFMALPIEFRTNHLDLSTPCEIIENVSNITRQRRAQKFLLQHLGLNNDILNWKTGGVRTCHACVNDSQKELVCSNPLHLYLGSPFNNYMDITEHVRVSMGQTKLDRRSAGGKKGSKTLNAILWEDPDHPELGQLQAGPLACRQIKYGLPHGPENRVRVKCI